MIKKFIFILPLFTTLAIVAQTSGVWLDPNQGQWDKSVLFATEINAGRLYVLEDGLGFNFYNPDLVHQHDEDHDHAIVPYEGHYVKTTFVGALWSGKQSLKHQSAFYKNYFLGSDQSRWKSAIHSYKEAELKDVYPGISLQYSTKNDGLKYTWIVQPHVDPSQIQIQFKGANSAQVLANGSFMMEHSFGKIFESAPYVYQIINGVQRRVDCQYRIRGDLLTYELGAYNTSEILYIDPSLSFSSFSGSTADNWGSTATPDENGNVFGGGVVFGQGLPVTPGAYDPTFAGASSGVSNFDISILKFSSNGANLLYCTYLGGTGNEFPSSMISNPNNELYIMGITSSSNFPINGGFSSTFQGGTSFNRYGLNFTAGSDIFIAKLNATGTNLLNSTYIGGSGNDGVNLGLLDYNLGDSYRGEINLDGAGNVYIASSTQSVNFPLSGAGGQNMNGTLSAVAMKLNATLNTILWSRYISGSGVDSGMSIEIAGNGSVVVGGGTTSTNLVLGPGWHIQGANAGGHSDGYILVLNGLSGATIQGTYIGQSGYDQVYFVQLDLSDNIYVLGQTDSSYPITPGKYGNANSGQFIRQYDIGLTTINWTTMIGASTGEVELSPTAFLVSNCYRIYLSGWGGTLNNSQGQVNNSTTTGFPTTPDAYQSTTNGSNFYIAVLEPDATALKYGTFFGNLNSSSNHVDGGTSRFDKVGNIYHAVCGACGGNPNGFTTTPGAYSTTNNSTNCNLAVFKFELGFIQALASVTDPLICDPEPVVFQNFTQNANTYQWDFGDGTFSNIQSPTHSYPGAGSYTVTLIVSDSNGCYLPDTTTLVVDIGDFNAGIAPPTDTLCRGDSYQLSAFGGTSYSWSPGVFLNDSTIPDPIATLDTTTTFTVIISDSCGGDTLQVTLEVFNDFITPPNDTMLCIGQSYTMFLNGATQAQWTPITYLDDPNSTSPTTTPDSNIVYTYLATSVNGCQFVGQVGILMSYDVPQPMITDSVFMCLYDTVHVVVGGATSYSWLPHLNPVPGQDSVFVIDTSASGYYVCGFTNSCGTLYDSLYAQIHVPSVVPGPNRLICEGDTTFIFASGANSYMWTAPFSLDTLYGDTVFVHPPNKTLYTVIGTDSNGCSDTTRVEVGIRPTPLVSVYAENYFLNINEGTNLTANASPAGGSFLWYPADYLTCTDCQSTYAKPDGAITYYVEYTDLNGCSSTAQVRIEFEPLIWIPNTFTPDGDQHNNVFSVVHEGVNEFECLIFNRWGEVIAELTKNNNAWDGTYKGKLVQEGVYTWKLTFIDRKESKHEKVGFVTVLK